MGAQFLYTSVCLLLFFARIAVGSPSLAKENCREYCGNVRIPYPFGIGNGCFLNKWFQILCHDNISPPKIFLPGIQMEVLEFGVNGFYSPVVRVNSPIISRNCGGNETSKIVNLTGSPFFFNSRNILVAAGCNNRASLAGTKKAIIGCDSDCRGGTIFDSGNGTKCDGDTCCHTNIPSTLQQFNVKFDSKEEGCKLAFLVDQYWFHYNMTGAQNTGYVPAMLRWGIDFESLKLPKLITEDYMCFTSSIDLYLEANYTNCYCVGDYEGNPYLPNGCDECKDPKRGVSFKCYRRKLSIILGISIGMGVLLLLTSGWQLYKFLKKRKKIMLRKKFFKRNGGFLLQQQLFSTKGGIQKAKIFVSKELEKATDRFNKNRILGKGGQGTVYKGMLVDGRIVAVKKSIAVDADKVDDFINEVVILSQIDHRNVVKLIGCCLETEVPLLVYEFISNGTLFQYLHDQTEEFQLTWEMRLRIAIETADALSYLHSSASCPIYHRDIKSTNILLDEKYKAKVSDFGTSRSLAIDQTHLTTNVQGTFGYLDPEYFQSSQFTDKSDVYSFGVVLVELITGKNPISLIKVGEEGRSLAIHFMFLMQENQLFEIVDTRIMHNSVPEEIMVVAKLAYRCLSLSGKNRPTMREIAIELGQIPSLRYGSNAQHSREETENVICDETNYAWQAIPTSISLDFIATSASSFEIEPFIYNQYF